jgi:hypothetical protein
MASNFGRKMSVTSFSTSTTRSLNLTTADFQMELSVIELCIAVSISVGKKMNESSNRIGGHPHLENFGTMWSVPVSNVWTWVVIERPTG